MCGFKLVFRTGRNLRDWKVGKGARVRQVHTAGGARGLWSAGWEPGTSPVGLLHMPGEGPPLCGPSASFMVEKSCSLAFLWPQVLCISMTGTTYFPVCASILGNRQSSHIFAENKTDHLKEEERVRRETPQPEGSQHQQLVWMALRAPEGGPSVHAEPRSAPGRVLGV